MQTIPIKISGKLWMWQGKGAWHFVTIEKDDAEGIVEQYMWPRRGFGSIPVKVTMGKTSWKTSIFPEKGGSFLLPIKKSVREVEGIKVDDTVKITIEVSN
jgi:hypothetical protein